MSKEQINEQGLIPPQALELEEDILGALLLEKDAYEMVSDILTPECFYKKSHEHIFKAIRDLSMQQLPVDMHTVTEQLRKKGVLEDVGGAYFITLLTSRVATSAHLVYHARIVLQKYLGRQLTSYGVKIQAKSLDETIDVDDLMQEAEADLFKITQRTVKKEARQINTALESSRQQTIEASKKDGTSGIPTGFTRLDKMTSGAAQINDAVNEVNEISQQNKESIESLVAEVGRFKV